MQTILLVGSDPALLESRAVVLGRTGCRTISASMQDAVSFQERHQAELVVLCHTLSDLTARSLIGTIRGGWPQTRILQVLRYGQEATAYSSLSIDAVCSSHPETLLQTVSQLLGNAGLPAPESSDRKGPMYLH